MHLFSDLNLTFAIANLKKTAVSGLLLLTTVGAKAQHWKAAVTTGWSTENFHWSIAGNSLGKNPDVYSELVWKNLSGHIIQGNLSYRLNSRIVLYLNGYYVDISKGKVTDTDYQLDHKQGVIFYGLFDSDKGYDYSVEGKAGWQLLKTHWFDTEISAGYINRRQSFWLLDHKARYNAGLNSNYGTYWNGVLVGTTSRVTFTRFMVSAAFNYAQVGYNAKGNWNLITEFEHPVSYTHHASGFGLRGSLDLEYRLTGHCDLVLTYQVQKWKTGKGTDRLYRTTGERPETLLNGVNEKNNALLAGLQLHL